MEDLVIGLSLAIAIEEEAHPLQLNIRTRWVYNLCKIRPCMCVDIVTCLGFKNRILNQSAMENQVIGLSLTFAAEPKLV